MAKMIDEKPSFKGEGKVWNKLSEYLPSDMVVYNQREINGREYDFCVMAENLGIVVIEVKGWLAEKIIVNGVDNIDVEGYEKPQTSPKKQARAYRFAILNKISEKYNVSPLVLDMVCYPFISKAEYESSRLDIVSEEQYTIFKEDLEDCERLNNKIINVFQVNSVIPHSVFSSDLMFRIRRSLEPNIKENVEDGKVLPYSKLYIIPDMPNTTEVEEMIDTYFMGVKSIIFVGDSACYKNIIRCLNDGLRKHNVDYKKNNLYLGYYKGISEEKDDDCFRMFNFEIYHIDSLGSKCSEKIVVKEGKVTPQTYDVLRTLSECSAFNLQQYEVEHASTLHDILVEAGAGTGKTFSMVSRIAYLCNKEVDAVSNIADGGSLCRISSVVGTTNNYLQHNFKDNHKDRITKYVYIPSDVLDEDGLYEFVARYVNTMSLNEDIISDWVNGHANPEDYPIHDVVEGKNWEYINVGHEKKINIYPFTKNSILYFYNNVLEKGHQTPRYIIRDIIEPVVRDAIFNKENFPSIDVKIVNVNTTLSFRIHSQVDDQDAAARLLKFMSVWGNGTPDQYEENGKIYISAISKDMYDDFSFPVLQMDKVEAPKTSPQKKVSNNATTPKVTSEVSVDACEIVVPAAKIKKVNDANTLLTKWTNEKKIDISATVGAAGTVHSAIYDEIPDYLFTAINWQVEGISMDNARKVKDSAVLLVALEGQTKKEGLYVLPANWNSINIILAFIRWKEYGNKSWNYPDADFDAYLITTWTEAIKKTLVTKVSEYKSGIETKYIEAAVSAEIYRTILAGEFREKSLKNFNLQTLFASKPNKATSNSHCSEWKSLVSVMSQKSADVNNQQTVRRYFNIGQGGASTNVVLDAIALSKVFGKVKKSRLIIEPEEKQNDDRIKQRRDAYTFLNDIEERIESVAKSELENGKAKLQRIYDAFGDNEIGEDELTEFISRVKKFYEEANKAQVNVKEISLDGIKKVSILEKAISDIAAVLDEDDPLTIIMAFSGDPVTTIKPLIDIIDALETVIAKANTIIANKKAALGPDGEDSVDNNRYSAELESINKSRQKIEGMVKV